MQMRSTEVCLLLAALVSLGLQTDVLSPAAMPCSQADCKVAQVSTAGASMLQMASHERRGALNFEVQSAEERAGTPTWNLVFRQTMPGRWHPDEWSRNHENPSADNYAILDRLEEFRMDGAFEFKMVWPGHEEQQWRQTSNPVKMESLGVEGYEPVSVPWTQYRWGGLENNGNRHCLLDGSANDVGLWFYAIGSFSFWGGGYPGPHAPVQKVELYVRAVAPVTTQTTTISPAIADNTTWRVRVVESHWTVGQYFAINELEFLLGTDCDSATKVTVSHEQAIESGSVWGLPGAFDGSTIFESRWNGRAAANWWDYMEQPNMRFLGMTGLPDRLGCVRIYAPDVYMPANQDFAVAVERFDEASAQWISWGPAWGAVHHLIFPNMWNDIVLQDPAHALCAENEHVVDGRCAVCPSGLVNAAGDDTAIPGGTACDVLDVHSFEVGDSVEGSKMATRCQPQRRESRAMHSTSCGGDKLLVSFTTQTAFPGYRSCSLSNFFNTTTDDVCWEEPDETMPHRPRGCIFPEGGYQGHIALYQRESDGRLRELHRAHLPFCEEMGRVTANADCTVLAALCLSRADPDEVPNVKSNLIEENWFECQKEQKACHHPGGFYEDPVIINKPDWVDPTSGYFAGNYTGGAWFYDTRKVYLLEWLSGAVSATPDASALVNSAAGGAPHGSWEIHLNEDASLYFLDLKSVIFAHQGDKNYHEADSSLSVQRMADGGFRWYNDPLPASAELVPTGSGWGISCGAGHPLWHVASYNPVLNQWGRWCWTDSFSMWFRIAGEVDKGEVYRQTPADVNGQYGQPTDMALFGSRGWVAVMTAYVNGSEQPGVAGPITRVGLVHLPASGAAGMIAAGVTGGNNTAVRWLDMGFLAPVGKGVGWAKLVHIGNDAEEDRFLLGYAVFAPKGPPNWYDWPEQFMLVEVTHDGRPLTRPVRVDNAGWSFQSTWSFMRDSRCVAWPGVWADAADPLGRGPSHWYTEYGASARDLRDAGVLHTMYSSTLRIMTYCPDNHLSG